MIIGREDLKKEIKEEVVEFHTPASRIVKELFSKELSAHLWAKYKKVDDLSILIQEKAKELNIAINEPHVVLLRKAVSSTKTIEQAIMKMTSFLIGEAQ